MLRRIPLAGWMRALLACAIGGSLLMTLPVAAQSSAAPGGSQAEAPVNATLRYFNQDIVTLRATRNGHTPEERVAAIGGRIGDVLADQPDARVTLAEQDEGVAVLLGGERLFVITRRDLDPDAGRTLYETADEARDNLRTALEAVKAQRQTPLVLKALAYSAVATVVFLAGLWLLLRARAWLVARMPRIGRAIAGRLAFGGQSVLQPMLLAQSLKTLLNLFVFGGVLFLLYLWAAFVLQQFPYTQPWGDELGRYLRSVIATVALGIIGALPGLVFVLIIVVMTRFLTRVLGAVFDAVRRERIHVPGLYPDTAEPTQKIVNALLWIFALVIAYPYLPGSGTEAFKAVGVFAGLLISLGSAGVVGQVMSGVVLMYSRGLRQGEYVRIKEIEGRVVEVGLLSTKIETPKRQEVTIPNGVLVSNEIHNLSRLAEETGAIAWTTATIGYDTPWRQVEAMLLEAAARTEELRKKPAPFVLQTGLADFYAEYQLNVYLKTPDAKPRAIANLHRHVQDVFNEHGVQIMSPHYVADPPAPKVVEKSGWFAPPAVAPPVQIQTSSDAP
jgi:small-conductance mechanosensitive channel